MPTTQQGTIETTVLKPLKLQTPEKPAPTQSGASSTVSNMIKNKIASAAATATANKPVQPAKEVAPTEKNKPITIKNGAMPAPSMSLMKSQNNSDQL